MKLFLLALFPIILSCNASEPSFLENTLINRQVSDLRKTYGVVFIDHKCGTVNQKYCDNNKLECLCHRVELSNMTYHKKHISLVSSQGKVIQAIDTSTTLENLFAQNLETAKNVFGNEAPSGIYEMNSNFKRHKGFLYNWITPKGSISATVVCPLEKVGGNYKVDIPLRSCLVISSRVSRIQELDTTEFKPSELKY